MIEKILFEPTSQNSILTAQLFVDPINMPECVYINIECLVYTPLYVKLVLTSIPVFHEPENFIFYYKCLIPYNALPSFDTEFYKIKYKFIILNVYKKEKCKQEFEFQVSPNRLFNDYKYDIFIDFDMIRIDEIKNDNITAFSKIVKAMRHYKLNEGKVCDEINEGKVCDEINRRKVCDEINRRKVCDKINEDKVNEDKVNEGKVNDKVNDKNNKDRVNDKMNDKNNKDRVNDKVNDKNNKDRVNDKVNDKNNKDRVNDKMNGERNEERLKDKIKQIKLQNDLFNKIIKESKNKGDIFYYYKITKPLKTKKVECKIEKRTKSF